MPMFHSNAIMAGWGPALAAGATIALAPTVLGVRLPARRTSLRRDVRQLRRQAADLHHGDARAARRRGQPAAAGLRQRGQRPRHRRLRAPLRLCRRRLLLLHRERRHRPAGARHAGRQSSAGPSTASRCSIRRRWLEVPDAEFGAGRRAAQRRSRHRRAGQHRRRRRVRRLLPGPGRRGRADARRDVLVRRPRLPRRRRASSTSPAAPPTGSASTARTSAPHPSSGSCCATPPSTRPRSTPCPTSRSATR